MLACALATLMVGQTAQGKSDRPPAIFKKIHSKILMPTVKGMELPVIISWQKRIIRHDKWVIRTSKHHHAGVVKWHKAQLKWVQRELKQSLSAYAALVQSRQSDTYSGASGICYSCWDRVANCESSGNWSEVTGNGFYWGLQWVPSTWDNAARGVGLPSFKWYIDHHTTPSREQQIYAASKLSLSNWPVCGSRY